ncbi:50S ribosomal protein L28 [Mycoplasma phocimorsus]|uniref:50S ribosomal protein L28 n=1 Tax=Mycoplasma phocimorsus TaxID=3045839 RepID=UPI0024C0B050|nr:50S ribosomal protein L28 [Mycoplasma phocimorsus]MDJ1647025.1 50S ribosomal protein L28 [Mycoplasma phocimorsus]MDJ1647466.1 50S ribosomal protein L28 [Mycoplasma phocimorsus]
MSRQDMLTGKRAMSGNTRSHALNASKRKFNLNLQKVTIIENGQKKTLRVTAKTAKTARTARTARTLKKYGVA